MSEAAVKSSKAGAFYMLFIGLMLALVGGVFVWLLTASYLNAKHTREWTKVDCLIIQSAVEERVATNISPEFRWDVSYKYEFEGKSYIGDKLAPRGQRWSSGHGNAEAMMEKYPLDSKQVCFVNPEKPKAAILEHDTKAAGYTVWFPGVFVLGGVGIMVGAVGSFFKK